MKRVKFLVVGCDLVGTDSLAGAFRKIIILYRI